MNGNWEGDGCAHRTATRCIIKPGSIDMVEANMVNSQLFLNS